MNSVNILGNLATAPKSSILPSGTVKASALVAINEHYTDAQGNTQSRAVFVWVEAFGKLAINFSKWCVLGQQVAISGRLAGGNKEINGQWRNCTVVQASEIQFLAKPQSQLQDSVKVEPIETVVADVVTVIPEVIDAASDENIPF